MNCVPHIGLHHVWFLLHQLNTRTRIAFNVFFFIEIFNTQREWRDSGLHKHIKGFKKPSGSHIQQLNEGNWPLGLPENHTEAN